MICEDCKKPLETLTRSEVIAMNRPRRLREQKPWPGKALGVCRACNQYYIKVQYEVVL
jgi:uncharacterized protein with PIN domain